MDGNTEYLSCLHTPCCCCCTQHASERQDHRGSRGRCGWTIIMRTNGFGLSQRGAGGSLLRYALARLVSSRMNRPEITCSYSYSYSLSYRVACKAQQHHNSSTLSNPPSYCGSSSNISDRKLLKWSVVLMLMLTTNCSPRCCLLCRCLRSWVGSGGIAVNSAAGTVAGLPLLLPRSLFFCFLFAALPHIPTSLLDFGGAASRIWFTSSAKTPTS